jgi:hypothetical protein
MTPFSILLVAFLQAGSGPQQVEEGCTQGRISHIFIDNHSIFDPATIPDEGWLRWTYRLANTLHMRTRADFIEAQLPFGTGDCYDPELVRESARILREFRFIAGADAYGVPQPDGTIHVVVDTHDEWTTKVSVVARFDEGVRFEGASLIEENFLGRGIALGLVYTQREEQRDVSVGLEVPHIRRTNWDGRLSVGATRIGELVDQKLIYPFRGELEGVAVRQEVTHRRDFFNYVLDDGGEGELSHVVVPVQEERMTAGFARRFGRPGGFLVLGGGLSWERVGTGTVSQVEGVRGGDFANRVPASPEVARAMEHHLRNRQALRVNALAGLRRIRHQEVVGFDAIAGVQDLPLGREILLTLGPSLGTTGLDQPSDVFGRVDLFEGARLGSAFAFLGASTEVRRESGGAWRDLLTEARGVVYYPTRPLGSPMIVLRSSVQEGRHTGSPFQLVLGGPDGVRGYSDTALPGGRRIVLSGEGRWHLPGPVPDLADLGVTLFGDAGRMWAGDAPHGVDSGWRTTLGAGLRVGFPAGTSSVIRFDLAVPMDGGTPRSPLLRISAREWIGLRDDTRNLNLLRSRRSGMSVEFQGIASDQRPPG